MLKIIGTGRAVPDFIADNAFFERLVDTSDEWIVSRTGIKTRHILKEGSLTELAFKAAKNALDNANIKPNDLDLIICSSLQGDYITPSLACCVKSKIKATCPAFDINAACAGFIYSLNVAAGLIKSEIYNNVLIISAERLSKFVDYTDRSTCVLFGDGAGAAVVTEGNALRYINVGTEEGIELLFANSGLPQNCFTKKREQGFITMNGPEIFKFATQTVLSAIKDVGKRLSIKADDIKWFLLHQANGRIIDTIRKTLKQPQEKFPENHSKFGNTSAASIPMLMDELNREGKFKKGDLLFLSAFGGGLTKGSCVITWDK